MAKRFNSTSLQTAIAVDKDADNSLVVDDAALLHIDKDTGRLLVDTEANLTADLSLIESKQDTTNALLTTQAADLASVKTQLATGSIAVTGGGGGGGGASAAYNSTLPTYTSGASSTLQTDVNGRLITTPSVQLGGGVITSTTQRVGAITSNNPAPQTISYSFTGAISSSTVVIPSTAIGSYRNIAVADIAVGTGGQIQFQFSNDNTNWIPISFNRADGSTNYSPSNVLYQYTNLSAWTSPTYGFLYFRMIVTGTVTSGLTSLVVSLSNTTAPSPILTSTITGSVTTAQGVNVGSQGFYSFHTLVSAAGTNATTISGQRNVGTIWLTNTTASWRFIKIYNASTFTVGTTTPNLNVGIPPNSTIDLSTSFWSIRVGTALSYALTTGSALLDATAVSAGDFLVNITYL
jgi:hypothetical protein